MHDKPEKLAELIAFVVNTLGGGIVGAIVALCLTKFESASEGFKRTVVSVIASGTLHVPAVNLIRWKWPDIKDEFGLRFGVQLVLGMFGYYLFAWPMNEVEGTQRMKLSSVLTGFMKAFGPVFSKIGPWLTKIGSNMGRGGSDENKHP